MLRRHASRGAHRHQQVQAQCHRLSQRSAFLLLQVSPKSCGHVRNKQVVGRAEAVQRVRAAVDARQEGQDIVIVARSDARQADSLQVCCRPALE